MHDLAESECVPCRSGTPPLPETEIQQLKIQVPGWEVVVQDGIKRLVRTYRFKNFFQALTFVNKVGEIAEAEDHHPEILLAYGKATVSWWTHTVKGLHRNDFIMSARTDKIFEQT